MVLGKLGEDFFPFVPKKLKRLSSSFVFVSLRLWFHSNDFRFRIWFQTRFQTQFRIRLRIQFLNLISLSYLMPAFCANLFRLFFLYLKTDFYTKRYFKSSFFYRFMAIYCFCTRKVSTKLFWKSIISLNLIIDIFFHEIYLFLKGFYWFWK